MKNIFWESKEEETTKVVPSKKGVTTVPIPPVNRMTSPPDYNYAHSDAVNTKFKAFKASKDAMSSIPVEATRYVAAFAGLAVSGLTKDDLLAGAQVELNNAAQETANFMRDYGAAYNEKVVNKKQILGEKSKQLADLTAEITALDSQIKEDESHLLAGKDAFMKDQKIVTDAVNEEVNKIKQYI